MILKSILSEVNPMDITLVALPVYLLIVLAVGFFRRGEFRPVAHKTRLVIFLMTVIGTANMYLMRYAQKLAPNSGYAIALASTSIVPLTLLQGASPSAMVGVLSIVGGSALITHSKVSSA